MPLARSFRFAPFALPIGLAIASFFSLPAMPAAVQPAQPRPAPVDVEVRCLDDSTMKLKLLDERIEVVTKYGKLEIPAADVRRIEFATRTPSEVNARVSLLISNLNHPDFDMREKAMAELREMKERAYPLLLKAIKNPDAEISRRAEESVKHLQQRVPAAQLEARETDVIHTDDSKITGKLSAVSFRVQTSMFGEQTLRLSDVRSLKAGGGGAEDAVNAAAAPGNMTAYQNQFGKELVFTVTAPQMNGQAPSVWGTDVYTLDSNLAGAALHAGQVQAGQTGVVRVRVVASPPQYTGSVRNGVTSAPYASYPSGAFEFVKK
ncbi:MAG: LCCL domain-containing protein [Gemmataceae bacterium]